MWLEAREGLHTVRDLLRFAVSRFTAAGLAFGHGTDNAYDEAAYLILHTLGLPLDRLDPFLDARLLASEMEATLSVLERRVEERIPAAYLTHEAWLGDFRFYVDERVIVPRSHIAGLLEQGLGAWTPSPDRVGRALDLCTGCGCLAIVLAAVYPNAKVDAADLSPDALEVARRNVREYGLEDRVRVVQSDLFAALAGERYDVIVSNPPYVTQSAIDRLPDEYRHEPAMALAGGADGLEAVRRILHDAKAYLNRGGILVVEIGDGRETLETAFPQIELTWLETAADGDQVFLLERGQLPD